MNGAVNAPLPGTVQLTSSGRQPPPIKPNNKLSKIFCARLGATGERGMGEYSVTRKLGLIKPAAETSTLLWLCSNLSSIWRFVSTSCCNIFAVIAPSFCCMVSDRCCANEALS